MVNSDTLFERPSNKKYNILIVEDSEFVNNSVNKTLERFGYKCEQVFSVKEAVEQIKVKEYNFILFDLNLPDALGSDRCYKKAWDDERIFNLFEEEKGKHFDPKLTDLFLDNRNEFIAIRDKYKDV